MPLTVFSRRKAEGYGRGTGGNPYGEGRTRVSISVIKGLGLIKKLTICFLVDGVIPGRLFIQVVLGYETRRNGSAFGLNFRRRREAFREGVKIFWLRLMAFSNGKDDENLLIRRPV